MKRLFLLAVFAVVVGCGTEPEERKQDSLLYGKWLFIGIDMYRNYTNIPKSSVDISWEFDAEKILWSRSGFDYTHNDTTKVSGSREYCCWYTRGGEIFYTDTSFLAMRFVGKKIEYVFVENRIGYTFNENGNLVFTSSGSRLQGDKDWEYARIDQCNICNVEATKQ